MSFSVPFMKPMETIQEIRIRTEIGIRFGGNENETIVFSMKSFRNLEQFIIETLNGFIPTNDDDARSKGNGGVGGEGGNLRLDYTAAEYMVIVP
ncbi:hypothetical protein E1B28_006429 [Marasmius oreades]|uniref:Uncharacterized protein n=1 Tax=Marasmius oreades TaxID=181124 RepID=A0A9P7UW58_9AGAR|nr:uncharacterized protein E1B28_006429 [Marasmius oreades]KAG7095716.1 hypothetical protein E1B28_006429 [Marasmius oreades]